MQRIYSTPVATAEEFEANEYVASCYSIYCDISGQNNLDATPWGGVAEYATGKGETLSSMNHNGSCKDASRNFILTNDTVTANSDIREYSSDQGYISGKITSVVSGGVDGPVGDTVYWYTLDGDGSRRWNHKGVVTVADASHPNRS